MTNHSQTRAFSTIELLVSISVLAILAVLLSVNYSKTQSQARDTTRKADVAVIGSAVNQFATTTGNSFIRMPISGTPGQYQDCKLPSDAGTPPQPVMILPPVATDPGCVGASGRAFGKVNVKGVQLANAVTGQERTYGSHSIVEALVAANFLNSAPKDPRNNVGVLDTVDKAKLPDYVLIRSCPIPSGVNRNLQYVGDRGGAIYSVWAQLENTPVPADVANRAKSAGSFTTDNDGVWSWDMAVFNLEEYKRLQTNGFVYTNALVQTSESVNADPALASSSCEQANS